MSEVMAGICRIGVFLICARTIVHFRPKAVYEKYMKLLLGIMIVIQIVAPWKKGEFSIEISDKLWDFEEIVAEGGLWENGPDTCGTVEYKKVEEGGYGVHVDVPEVHITPIQVEVSGW